MLIEQMLERMPEGDLRVAFKPSGPAEGMALAVAFRGDVLVWLRINAAGRIDRCPLRDASWFQSEIVSRQLDRLIYVPSIFRSSTLVG